MAGFIYFGVRWDEGLGTYFGRSLDLIMSLFVMADSLCRLACFPFSARSCRRFWLDLLHSLL